MGLLSTVHGKKIKPMKNKALVIKFIFIICELTII